MDLIAFAELTARLDDPFADRDAVLRAAGLDEGAYAQHCAEWSARLEQQEQAQAFGDAYARVRTECSARRRASSGEEPSAAPADARFLSRDAQPWREQASAVPLSAADAQPPAPMREAPAPPTTLPKVVRPPAVLAATAGFVPGAALPFVAASQRAGTMDLPASSAAPSGTTDVAGFVAGPDAPFVAKRRLPVGAETADSSGFVPRSATPFEASPAPQRRLVRFDPQTGERLAEPGGKTCPRGRGSAMASDTSPTKTWVDYLRVLLVVGGYSTAVSGVLTVVAMWGCGCREPMAIVFGGPFFLVVAAVAFHDWVRDRLGAKARPLADVLVLGLLPLVGLGYNTLGTACRCHTHWFYRPLAQPDVLGWVGLHVLTALAYAVSRRRPAALHGRAEPILHAILVAGIVAQTVLAVHLRGLALLGILIPPFLPMAAPVFTILFYAEELVVRLRRRGSEAAALTALPPSGSAFRVGPPQVPLPPEPRMHRPTLVKALALAPMVLALWAVVQVAAFGGRPWQIFSQTCGYTLSRSADPIDEPLDCE